VLKGIEADILVDGRIDYDEAILERLDFVIASIHSRFNLNAREMTTRMLAAMDNPYVNIIGHPTGRLLLSRDPYGIDLDALFAKAAAAGVAMEINADPHRLDLDWRVLRRAREAGVTISIGADAHNVSGIGNVDYGVGMARKGWLGPDDVVNTRPVEDFLAFAAKRRKG
jgi:DNA polymerase (family 10)